MPLVYWLTVSAYIGAAAIGFLNCDAYQKWQEKSEQERAAIIAAALEAETEADGEEAPEIIIIESGDAP